MATLKNYKVPPPIGENIVHCIRVPPDTLRNFREGLCVSCANLFFISIKIKEEKKIWSHEVISTSVVKRFMYVCKDIIVRKKNELMTTTTTTEDSSGQSAPERGAASQPASQPAKGACVDCKEHATEPYVAHTTPVVLLFPCLPSLAASTHWPQQNTSRLTSFSSSYIASPLVHQNRLFVRARESD